MSEEENVSQSDIDTTDLKPKKNVDIPRGGNAARQASQLREENKRLRWNLDEQQHLIYQYRQAQEQLEQELDNLHRSKQNEIEVYEINLREAIEEFNQLYHAYQELRRRYLEPDHLIQKLPDTLMESPSTIQIHITEEPLTAQNLATIISSLTDLHTKAWLIQQGRFSDLINYGQTRDLRFTKEANLVIGKFIHFSPALIELLLNPATLATAATAAVTLAGALKIAIDNVGQSKLRYRATELENRKKELDIKIREHEVQQTQKIATQQAELERQKTQLELAKQQLEIQEQLLEFQKKSLEVERDRIEIALETASKMVDTLHPGVDMVTKGMLVQPLLPTLLQLSTSEGLELALPEPHKPEESIKKKEKQ